MQEQRDDLHHGVHVKTLQPVVEEGENARADKGSGPNFGPVDEIPCPLLEESSDEGAGQAEAEADEPERVAY